MNKNFESVVIFLTVAAAICFITFGIYVITWKNLNKAGIGAYTVVVHFSDEDRALIRDIRDSLKKDGK